MDEHRYQSIREVFHQVCDLPAAEQDTLLTELCGQDTDLRQSVEQLLTAIRDADEEALTPESVMPAEFTPSIEGYTIIRLLGEGGMGSVYEAEQLQPTRRVAIKILRIGYTTKALTRRFQLEAEALARLKHPCIAQVYEVGIDQAIAQPYIAMELVEGPTLKEHIRLNALTTRDILEFSSHLCDAVEHAHQRGVIHRDLKPANILVDESGAPKILDFGIARVTEQDVRAVTMNTEIGQIIGTLAYMSPEQASGDPTQIDHRSDVYSLGVILFELLTGQLPHKTNNMQLADALSVVRDHDPTRISSLDTRLRGDIDTIISKALERDPARRYQSAAEFGNDIRRHLADEPVLARPPSRMYQLQKFAKRNKGLVASVCIVITLLTVGVVSLSIALQRESLARQSAEESLVRSTAAYEFLDEIFLGLDPKQTEGRDTELLRMMLDRAAERARTGIEIPIVRAEMLTLIALTFNAVFAYEEAAIALRDAIELYESTSPLNEQGLHQARSVLAASLFKLGQLEEAEQQFELLVAYERETGDLAQLSTTLRQFSEMMMETGRFDEALSLIEEASRVYTDHDVLEQGRQQLQMGAVLRRLNRYEEASAYYHEAKDHFMRAGAELETSITLNSLAIIARRQGSFEQSEAFYTESIALRGRVDSRLNPDTAASYANLGRLYNQMGRYQDAVEVLRISIAQHIELFRADHPNLTYPRLSLAEALSRQGLHDEALEEVGLAKAIAFESLPEGHPLRVLALTQYGHVYRERGEHQLAVESYEVALSTMNDSGPDGIAYALPIWDGYTKSARELGDFSFEAQVIEKALRVYPEDDKERDLLENRLVELKEKIGL
ncbi:MAG: serine/threonine-protein kinase [Phycisphaerales bacterium]